MTPKLPPPPLGEVGKVLVRVGRIRIERWKTTAYYSVTDGSGELVCDWPNLVALAREILRIEKERGK